MSSEPTRRGHSLALRLTLWYSGIFVGSCALAFAFVYGLIVATVQERLDEDLSDDVEEFAALYESGGQARVVHEMQLDTKGEEAEKSFFRLWARDGRLVLATDLSAFPRLGPPPEAVFEAGNPDEPVLETLHLPGREHPVRAVYGAISGDLIVEIGESVEDDEEFVAALLRGFVAPLIACVLLGLPAGWFLARRALRGVEDVTRTATEIAAGALDQRVAVQGEGDELARLLRAQCSLRADRQRLQRVIANLLDNALKYTPPGGEVKITLLDEGPRVRLSFEDTGVGISPEEQERIFERFYRSDRSRSQPGNGLGLALCLANVRAHGGEISVESEPGRGSTFTVTLFR